MNRQRGNAYICMLLITFGSFLAVSTGTLIAYALLYVYQGAPL